MNIISQVHAIRGVIDSANFKEVLRYVSLATKEKFQWNVGANVRNGKIWASYVTGTAGSKLWFDDEVGLGSVAFYLTGTACERMGLRNCWRMIVGLKYAFDARFTRIDLKCRVPSTLFTPNKLFALGQRGQLVGCRNKPSRVQSECKLWRGGVETTGYSYTTYFGSRQSQSYTRVYDPYSLHGVKDCTDIEVEFKEEKAQAIGKAMVALPVGVKIKVIAQKIVDLVFGQIDFREPRKASYSLERRERLPQWQSILDSVKAVPLKVIAPVIGSSLSRFKRFLERQVLNGLSALCSSYGLGSTLSWLREEVITRESSLPRGWLALVEEARNTSELADLTIESL